MGNVVRLSAPHRWKTMRELGWSGQRQKMDRHPVLNTCVVVTPLQMPGDDQVRDHTFIQPA